MRALSRRLRVPSFLFTASGTLRSFRMRAAVTVYADRGRGEISRARIFLPAKFYLRHFKRASGSEAVATTRFSPNPFLFFFLLAFLRLPRRFISLSRALCVSPVCRMGIAPPWKWRTSALVEYSDCVFRLMRLYTPQTTWQCKVSFFFLLVRARSRVMSN